MKKGKSYKQDRRRLRAKEKGSQVSQSKMMGDCARRGWGIGLVDTDEELINKTNLNKD